MIPKSFVAGLALLLTFHADLPTALGDQRSPGEARVYYQSGALKGEFPYIRGRLEGTVRWYYESGALGALLNYKQNRLDGVTQTFYESGRLHKMIRLQNNQPVGFTKYFAEDGHLSEVYTHRNGMPAVRWSYDNTGIILGCEDLLGPAATGTPPGQV
jgi:antitoxin component YwqK of YwqJK toxin-antitoxin module